METDTLYCYDDLYYRARDQLSYINHFHLYVTDTPPFPNFQNFMEKYFFMMTSTRLVEVIIKKYFSPKCRICHFWIDRHVPLIPRSSTLWAVGASHMVVAQTRGYCMPLLVWLRYNRLVCDPFISQPLRF